MASIGHHFTRTGLANNYIQSITIDKQDNKWFGTQSGLSKFDGTNWTIYYDSTYYNYIDAMAIDAQNNKWLCGGSVVSKFDGTNWTAYKLNAFDLISSIAIDSRNNKWIGATDGTYKFDGTNWTTFMTDTSAKVIAIDPLGNIWFGIRGVGVMKFDGIRRTIYNTANGLVDNSVDAIAFDNKGDQWFGAIGGLSKFDGSNWTNYTIASGLVQAAVYSIAIDAQGIKWIGTYGGVSKFDGINWTNYTTADGLIDNNVTSIVIDTHGNKWFGTPSGVSKFDDGGAGPMILNINEVTNNINNVQLYPNPSTNQVTLILPNPDIYNIIISDLSGKIIKQFTVKDKQMIIQTEDINSGVYLLTLKSLSNGNTYNNKIVVAK